MERRLAAILAADMVGYSRLMAADEAGTIERQKSHRAELIDPKIAQYGGRIVKTTGDGLLAEFPSVVDAVHCAVEMQSAMPGREAHVPEAERIRYRVGINLGDIVIDGEDILGDGVNIAARLEGLAEAGGICISESVYNQVRGKLDLIFDHLGEREVKNIPEPVSVYRVALDGKATALVTPVIREATKPVRQSWLRAASAAIVLVVAIGAAAILWPREPETDVPPDDIPSIAVLPFDNLSGDESQEHFSDGITDDLINYLSRISGLFVISRSSVFPYKGQSVAVQQVGRDLGVSYVLEGSVRKFRERVRINAQLIDAATGRGVWADRYDGDLTDVFKLQDEVVQKIVSALAVRLTPDEEERRRESLEAKVDPEAYDLLLRGLARFRRFTRDNNREARDFFERALQHDPNFARAHANIAWSLALDVAFDWSDDPERSLRLAMDSINSAIAIDDKVPQVHMALANIYRRQKRFDDALAAARRVIELDPNYSDGYAQLANSLLANGQPEEAVDAINKALLRNPRNPFFYRLILGRAKFQLGEYEEAAAILEKSVERNPEFILARIYLAATYGQLNRLEDAAWQVEEVKALQPEFSLENERQRNVYRRPEDLNRLTEGLRKAGLSK